MNILIEQRTEPPSKMKMKTGTNIQESLSQKRKTKIRLLQPARPQPSYNTSNMNIQRVKMLAPVDQNGHRVNATTQESKKWTSGEKK